ncbi:MAG: hypothetical protein JRJ87_26520 [Deltaproteobacteria bacterium]|nr:hypothetical protein [Deltaproteobacteria bacterium]
MSKKKTAKKKKPAKKKPKKKNSGAAQPAALPPVRSIESHLAGIAGMGFQERSAVDEAQEIIYDAWEAPTRPRAVALARKALTVSADCADAYNLLAELTSKSLDQAIDLFRKGVAAGERALGNKTFKDDVGHFWGILETRPYMRARAGLAQNLWDAGQYEEAFEHYREMLRLNTNDNQGNRYLLMPRLLEKNRDEEAEKLYLQFEGDVMAIWTYSRVLLDFCKHGESAVANKSLKAALAGNEYVPAYLLGRKKMPRDLPDYHGFGDDNEAIICVHESKTAWKATPGAMEWLADKMRLSDTIT